MVRIVNVQFSSVQFSRSVVSDSLPHHESLVNISHTILYSWNLLRQYILSALTFAHKRQLYKAIDVLINFIVVNISQWLSIITYMFNKYNFLCQLYINKVRKKIFENFQKLRQIKFYFLQHLQTKLNHFVLLLQFKRLATRQDKFHIFKSIPKLKL